MAAWTVSIEVTGKNRREVETSLTDKSNHLLQQLFGAGLISAEMRTAGLAVEDLLEVSDTDSSSTVTGYRGTQSIDIRSTSPTRVPAILDAYAFVANAAPPWMSVQSPTCSVEDESRVLAEAERAAWTDLDRQVQQFQTHHIRLGRVVTLRSDRGVVASDSGTWACQSGLTAHVAVSATYEVK